MPVRTKGKEQLESLSFESAFATPGKLVINEAKFALLTKSMLTFKQRADFPPAGNASFTCELPQSRFQEEDGNSAADEEHHIGNQECPCEGAEKQHGSRPAVSPSAPGSAVDIYYRAAHSALPAANPIWLGGLDQKTRRGALCPLPPFTLFNSPLHL